MEHHEREAWVDNYLSRFTPTTPEEQRDWQVLELYYRGKHRFAHIAQVLGLREGDVYARHTRAVLRMRGEAPSA